MHPSLQALREKPIPAPPAKSGYRSVPIDMAGAANAEPLAHAHDYGIAGENAYFSTRTPPYYHRIPGSIEALVLRTGAAERLRAVNARLAAAELELFLFDAWRPQQVQIYFHDVWLPQALQRRDPSLSGDALLREVETYWAAPSDGADAPSPHSTGGAVDLTLRWRGRGPLWMGSLFDDAAPVSHTDHFEAGAADTFSAAEARANRRLLYWLMREAGFASNPSEWWHFSYGDQMWAQATGAPAALYGEAAFAPETVSRP
jgi:D-alanyl-D-alanine dipeptidase